MIIYGHKTREKVIATGQFDCPKCEAIRTYNHKKIGQWFTLFFTPLFQIKELGEYVECESCLRAYKPEILSLMANLKAPVLPGTPENPAGSALSVMPDWQADAMTPSATPTVKKPQRKGLVWYILGGLLLAVGVVFAMMLLLGAAVSDPPMEASAVISTLLFCPTPFLFFGCILLLIGWHRSKPSS